MKLQQLKIKQGFSINDLEISDKYERLETTRQLERLIQSSNYKLTTINND